MDVTTKICFVSFSTARLVAVFGCECLGVNPTEPQAVSTTTVKVSQIINYIYIPGALISVNSTNKVQRFI